MRGRERHDNRRRTGFGELTSTDLGMVAIYLKSSREGESELDADRSYGPSDDAEPGVPFSDVMEGSRPDQVAICRLDTHRDGGFVAVTAIDDRLIHEHGELWLTEDLLEPGKLVRIEISSA